jgi:formiminoglutamase
VLATIDVDGIGAAWAPGVSATNPWGISADLALQLARTFGAHPAVACFDLMEYAPAQDRDGQTGRLLAFMVAAFIEGLAERG